MKEITSITNETIKKVCALHSAKGRKEAQQFIAEGTRIIKTFIEQGINPIALFVTQEMLATATDIIDQSKITLVTDAVMKKMSTATTPSGILGVFAIPSQLPASTLGPGLVLAQISDPGNMGTLIRTCAAFNIKNVICIEGVDPYNPKVVQASAGALASVNIFQFSWQELIQYKNNLILGALVIKGGQNPSAINSEKTLLVVGSEAHGIPDTWVADCEQKITIAMPGNTESLNAAVAASIAIYEGWKS